MATTTRDVRVSDRLDEEIRREAEVRGKSWSATTEELLEEAIRMRRAPGVVFVDGSVGRRAVIAGSGLDVWEVVAGWRAVAEDFGRLRAGYPQLTEAQLRAALFYYSLYPEEVGARLEREGRWTMERVRGELPFATPQRN